MATLEFGIKNIWQILNLELKKLPKLKFNINILATLKFGNTNWQPWNLAWKIGNPEIRWHSCSSILCKVYQIYVEIKLKFNIKKIWHPWNLTLKIGNPEIWREKLSTIKFGSKKILKINFNIYKFGNPEIWH